MPNDNQIMDRLSRLLSDAATAADGLRQDLDGFVKLRLERCLNGMDVVPRDEFEAVKALAIETAMQNERLKERLTALEKRPVRNRPIKKMVKKRYF